MWTWSNQNVKKVKIKREFINNMQRDKELLASGINIYKMQKKYKVITVKIGYKYKEDTSLI
jgi:hypothetical protein